MGDQQIGQGLLFPQVQQQIDDLGLNGHIQRRNGLVAQQQPGLHRQRTGDADALAHTAGELVGIAVDAGGVQTHLLHQGLHLLSALRLTGVQVVDVHSFGNEVNDLVFGVQ